VQAQLCDDNLSYVQQRLPTSLRRSLRRRAGKVQFYSLYGNDFGNPLAPPRLATVQPAATRGVSNRKATPTAPVAPHKVVLLYKPNRQPDENVIHNLEQQLRDAGHEVFVDNQHKINARWAQTVEERIRPRGCQHRHRLPQIDA
jgi:hypothetical protein